MNKTNYFISATRPWASPDAGEKIERWGTDTQAQIDFCLEHCPYADGDCVDCLSGGKGKDAKKPAHRPSKYNPDELKELLRLKKTDKEICDSLGVTARTIRNYKKKLAMSMPA